MSGSWLVLDALGDQHELTHRVAGYVVDLYTGCHVLAPGEGTDRKRLRAEMAVCYPASQMGRRHGRLALRGIERGDQLVPDPRVRRFQLQGFLVRRAGLFGFADLGQRLPEPDQDIDATPVRPGLVLRFLLEQGEGPSQFLFGLR